jgi:hypothetical protein
MPKGPQGPKLKKAIVCRPKSKKLPLNLPENPVSRAVAIMREATGEKATSAPPT